MSGLTDEERELRRLAEEAEAPAGKGQERIHRMAHFNARASPSTVLRLLARIEELANEVADMEHDAFIGRLHEAE